MVYRSDLLQEAGIANLPQTWTELRQASAEVFKKTGKAGFGFPAGSSASGRDLVSGEYPTGGRTASR